MNPRNGRTALARCRRAQDIDARQHRPEVIGGPTHKGEDAAGRERKDAAVTVNDLFRSRLAEPNSILDSLLEPQEFNGCEIAHLGRSVLLRVILGSANGSSVAGASDRSRQNGFWGAVGCRLAKALAAVLLLLALIDESGGKRNAESFQMFAHRVVVLST
jgi:hypothetical protein